MEINIAVKTEKSEYPELITAMTSNLDPIMSCQQTQQTNRYHTTTIPI